MDERNHKATGAELVISSGQIGVLSTNTSAQASEKFKQSTERVIMDSESEAEPVAFSTISRTAQHVCDLRDVSVQQRPDESTADDYLQGLLDAQLQSELNQHVRFIGELARAENRETESWGVLNHGLERSHKEDVLDTNTRPSDGELDGQHVHAKARGGSVRRGKRRKRAHQQESSSDDVVTSRREHEVRKRRRLDTERTGS